MATTSSRSKDASTLSALAADAARSALRSAAASLRAAIIGPVARAITPRATTSRKIVPMFVTLWAVRPKPKKPESGVPMTDSSTFSRVNTPPSFGSTERVKLNSSSMVAPYGGRTSTMTTSTSPGWSKHIRSPSSMRQSPVPSSSMSTVHPRSPAEAKMRASVGTLPSLTTPTSKVALSGKETFSWVGVDAKSNPRSSMVRTSSTTEMRPSRFAVLFSLNTVTSKAPPSPVSAPGLTVMTNWTRTS